MFVAICYERNSKLTQKTKINWVRIEPRRRQGHKNTQKFGEEHEIVQRLELGEQSQLHTYLKRQANLTITLTQDLAFKRNLLLLLLWLLLLSPLVHWLTLDIYICTYSNSGFDSWSYVYPTSKTNHKAIISLWPCIPQNHSPAHLLKLHFSNQSLLKQRYPKTSLGISEAI